MRVFLDARDLIALIDGSGSSPLDAVRDCLRAKGHQLAVSPTLVFEIAAPLVAPATSTIVMRRLNDLESLPLVYLADSQIPRRELLSAIQSFSERREYAPIDPYVQRFDAAIPISGGTPTAIYLQHGLAETVFTIWQVAPEAFRKGEARIDELRVLLRADRSLSTSPSLARHFREKLRRDLRLYQLAEPADGVDALADWIYQRPDRCPGTRLAYEVYHHLRKNLGDQPEASDFGDFAHIRCAPYVDLMTLDGRMADYVRRARQRWCPDRSGLIRHDLSAILRDL